MAVAGKLPARLILRARLTVVVRVRDMAMTAVVGYVVDVDVDAVDAGESRWVRPVPTVGRRTQVLRGSRGNKGVLPKTGVTKAMIGASALRVPSRRVHAKRGGLRSGKSVLRAGIGNPAGRRIVAPSIRRQLPGKPDLPKRLTECTPRHRVLVGRDLAAGFLLSW